MNIRGLTVIAILCLGIVIWIDFIDFKFQELFEGTGQKVENLIEGFCLSYISGYVFYVLNVYLIERREKKLILPLVARNVILIIVNNHSIINCLKNDSRLTLDYFPNKEEFKDLLSKINPRDKSPFYYQNENWIYLFKNRQQSTLDGINRIFLSGKHLDDKLRKILLEMQFSLYLKEDYAFNSDDFKETDLSKYRTVFVDYFELIKELKDYYDKNLKSYYQTTLPDSIKKQIKS